MNAVFFLSDAKYLGLTLQAIRSFQINNTWFDGDVNVLYADDNISQINIPGANVLPIDYDAYNSGRINLKQIVELIKVPKEKYKTIFKFEIFKYHKKYKKILFLDSDCLVMGSLKPLFREEDSKIYRFLTGVVNSGVIYSVDNASLYPQLLSRLSGMSREIVEELILSKTLTNFKRLNRKYNTIFRANDTVIYHMQNINLDEVFEIQKEYLVGKDPNWSIEQYEY